MVFLLFSLAISTKFQLCLPQKREECAWIHAGKRGEAVSGRVGSSSLQVGSCLTPATNLPKAPPLDSLRAFGAALLTLSKRRKGHEEKQRTRHKISAQTHGAPHGGGRRKTDPAGRDRRNLRFRIHTATALRRQAHHRQNGRPDHQGTEAAWGPAQASFYGHSGSGKSGKHGRNEPDAPVNPADH